MLSAVGGHLPKQKMRGRREKTPSRRILPVAVVVLLAGIAAFFLLRGCDRADVPQEQPGNAGQAAEQIAIPGYEALELRAGAKKQSLSLSNPAENNCYFQISLYLENNTFLWQSELIKPGSASRPMTLTRPLQAGSYPGARLEYACFRMDREKTPLNGAETKLTLWVK